MRIRHFLNVRSGAEPEGRRTAASTLMSPTSEGPAAAQRSTFGTNRQARLPTNMYG